MILWVLAQLAAAGIPHAGNEDNKQQTQTGNREENNAERLGSKNAGTRRNDRAAASSCAGMCCWLHSWGRSSRHREIPAEAGYWSAGIRHLNKGMMRPRREGRAILEGWLRRVSGGNLDLGLSDVYLVNRER